MQGTFSFEGVDPHDVEGMELRWNEWVDALLKRGLAPAEEPVSFTETSMTFRLNRVATPTPDALGLHGSLLTPAQLAERWATSARYLANLRSAGRGPAFLKLGAKVLYREEDVLAFEEVRRVRPERRRRPEFLTLRQVKGRAAIVSASAS